LKGQTLFRKVAVGQAVTLRTADATCRASLTYLRRTSAFGAVVLFPKLRGGFVRTVAVLILFVVEALELRRKRYLKSFGDALPSVAKNIYGWAAQYLSN
jgi:hypothetical protein